MKGKKLRKKSYYSDKFYVKWGSTVSLLCIARDKLLNDSPCLDTFVGKMAKDNNGRGISST
jgi:hypothetical protein